MTITTAKSQSLVQARSVVVLALAALAAASMWFYVSRVLVGYQITEAREHRRPRGNLSDLYPRWLGARELLLHHRNPYGDDVTREIQEGYYGRALDPSRPDDPKDEERFAYPVYVVFLLAPSIGLPFHGVQICFHWLLLGLTLVSVGLWLYVVRWRITWDQTAVAVLLTLGSIPAVQGIKLQQLSLLVAALLAGSAACVAGGLLFCGGALLALATIKPQLAWPLVAWFFLWVASDWQSRRRLAIGFALMMTILLGGAEIVLPGWWRMFIDAIGNYHRYTQNRSVLDVLIPWPPAARLLAILAVLVTAALLWRLRHQPADRREFGLTAALVMALTVLVVPMYGPYNQLLLLPAIFVLYRDRSFFLGGSRGSRFVYSVGCLAVLWPWLASLALSAILLLVSRSAAINGWAWPLYSTFATPVLIFALIYMDVRRLSA